MKKNFLVLFAVILSMGACQNFEIEHPNYKYTAGYFPYQFPVRTLILGDYIYDNENDNAHRFVISAEFGGVYENKTNRKFVFQVDNSLCNNILFSSGGEPIQAMPSNYYTLSSPSEIVIPKGKMSGGVTVQLTDAFFDDPGAIKRTYVVPLRLVSSNDVDTILSGLATMANPDPRIVGNWTLAPKNFTMFAVKYINEYDGTYLYYGKSTVKNAAGTMLGESTYKDKYVEYNSIMRFNTTARRQVTTPGTIAFRSVMPGNFPLVLSFDNNDNCTVSGTGTYTRTGSVPDPNDPEKEIDVTYTTSYQVSGNGKFVSKQKDSYTSFGNKDRDVINLNYTVVVTSTNDPNVDSGWVYSAEDSFVFRNRNVVMEVYTPALAVQ